MLIFEFVLCTSRFLSCVSLVSVLPCACVCLTIQAAVFCSFDMLVYVAVVLNFNGKLRTFHARSKLFEFRTEIPMTMDFGALDLV